MISSRSLLAALTDMMDEYRWDRQVEAICCNSTPASILEKVSMSLITPAMIAGLIDHGPGDSRCSDDQIRAFQQMGHASTAFISVRISWRSYWRKSLLAWLAACLAACNSAAIRFLRLRRRPRQQSDRPVLLVVQYGHGQIHPDQGHITTRVRLQQTDIMPVPRQQGESPPGIILIRFRWRYNPAFLLPAALKKRRMQVSVLIDREKRTALLIVLLSSKRETFCLGTFHDGRQVRFRHRG